MGEKPCYVYLIGRQTPDGGLCHPVKFGIAYDPGKRIKQMQTASPYRLAVVAAILMPERQYALKLEKLLHTYFADQAMVGEWFDVTVFDAAGALAGLTRDLLEHWGGSGEDLYRVLDWSGATALMARWAEEDKARSVQ